ncbi:MAG TPA: polysaccharide deacetylase family protein [Vicinamibacterales bacterium]|nr:polysaccharide deacetylase family protein [Vicinamibacterales bacterium]
MWVWVAVVGVAVLAHVAPFRFLFDVTDRTVWRMPQTDPPTIYLTFDDGPNPDATPALLDVLARHQVKATFFIIDEHLTGSTAPLVRRTFEEGHAVALHSGNRWLMARTPARLAGTLEAAAARMEQLTGHLPCRAFRPHGGNRSIPMLKGAARAGYTVVGWGWMLWDFNWFRARNADDIVPRLVDRASPGDIVVIHDGHHEDPRADRRYAIEAVDRLIPELRSKGFEFGVICPNQPRGSAP